MKRIQIVGLFLGVGALGSLIIAAIGSPSKIEAIDKPQAVSDLVARGHYLVHNIGMCIDCHSPRDERGEFVADRHLQGSPLAFTPTVPMPWMPIAPRIAGLPTGFSEADTAHFLMTGERPNGRPPPLPPMPPYRLSRDDAEAIAAYLGSLEVDPH